MPERALNLFPGVFNERAERALGFWLWPPTCICGEPAAGAAMPLW
jgi:hypothetical protein